MLVDHAATGKSSEIQAAVRVTAAMETDEAAEAIAFDGVLPETVVILVER